MVLIAGAGPYGLSVSAHLRALGVSHQIAGRPMDLWRNHMPDGMYLKSEPYASSIAAPDDGYELRSYCAAQGLDDYTDRIGPVPRERLLSYADWFTGKLVPDVIEDSVTQVTATSGGFRVTFAAADPVTVRQVVVATGVMPHAYVPPELSELPATLVTHTSVHKNLGAFAGRRVAVLGAGQSALETAALLQESGADTRLIVRKPKISWLTPNPETISGLGRIRRPVNPLCEGWHCEFWYTPALFRRLPAAMRVTKARTVLGPAGAWWLRERIEGAVDTLLGTQVTSAEQQGDAVRLTLTAASGAVGASGAGGATGAGNSTMTVDHVIVGTGFRYGVDRLTFLDQALRARIASVSGYPVLSRACETTVPGLYITGAPAAASLGPSMRFLAGTHNVARVIARTVASRAVPGGRIADAALTEAR